MGFGSVFNLLIRRFVGADEVEDGGLGKLKERIRERFGVVKERFGFRGRSENLKGREDGIGDGVAGVDGGGGGEGGGEEGRAVTVVGEGINGEGKKRR